MRQLTAVTCLYDLDRARLDGRSIDIYLDWLNSTLRLPIPFVVFLDPEIDRSRLHAKPGDTIASVPLRAFEPFRWQARVEAICAASRKQDISFLRPDYAMLMFSKFDMMERAAAGRDRDDGFLWLDAGISRFFVGDLANAELDPDAIEEIAAASLAVSITPTLLRDLERGRASRQYVGSSERLVSGGDIFVRAATAASVRDELYRFVEQEWLANGLWDNEQVALGYLLLNGLAGSKITSVTTEYAALLAKLFNLSRPIKRTLMQRILSLT